jgi:hypothetical protein
MDGQPCPEDDPEALFVDLLVEIDRLLRAGEAIDWDRYRQDYPDYYGALLRLVPILVDLNRLDQWWDGEPE